MRETNASFRQGIRVRKFDQQIVESVALRRQRLRNAVFFGPERWRRQMQDHVKPLLIGVIVTAVISAGCIATSFVMNLMDRQAQEQRQRNAPAVTTTRSNAPTSSAGPSRPGSTTPPSAKSARPTTTGTSR